MSRKKKWFGSLNHDMAVIAIFEDAEQRKWYLQSGEPGEYKWRPLKLSLRGGIAGKANFHLATDGERFADMPDLAKLREHHPELHDAVWRQLSKLPVPKIEPVDVFKVA